MVCQEPPGYLLILVAFGCFDSYDFDYSDEIAEPQADGIWARRSSYRYR
jgi:hypothetical protein